MYPCACCGHKFRSQEANHTYEICPKCQWEDDPVQAKDPDFRCGANHESLNEAKQALWVQQNLWSDGYFNPCDSKGRSKFGSSVEIYSVSLAGDIGESTSPFTPEQLISAILTVTSQTETFWFHILDPDNAISMWQYGARTEKDIPRDYKQRLQAFMQNLAPQGGNSYLGMLPISRQWLFLHALSPGNDLIVTFHGKPELTKELLKTIKQL